MPCANDPLHPRTERGQVTPLVALVLVLALVGAVGLGRLGGVLVDRAASRAAADAAALAGVAGGPEAAREAAQRSGGRIVEWTADGDELVVTVAVGDAEATSRAGPR